MAKMKVGKIGGSLISEGVHVFKVVACTDKYEDFGNVEYELQTSSGQKVKNRFNFVDGKGEVNEICTYYWFRFARACLNLGANDEPEIDFSDLVGCYVEAEVKHSTYIVKQGENKGEERTAANLIDKTYATAIGFEDAEAPADEDDNEDMDDFLND